MTPAISVIMPIYNAERYLGKSIESILNQTYRDFEFLVISEHNTSAESLAIIQNYHDERIHHMHNAERLGYVPSLNVGLKEAEGQFIARMDADDISKPKRFQMQVDYLTKHHEVGVLGTALELIDDEGRIIAKRQPPTDSSLTKWSLLFGDEIAHPSTMIRRSLFETYGPYDSDLLYGEDYALWLRLLPSTRIVNLPQVLLQRRLHAEQITEIYKRIPASESVRLPNQAIAATLGHEIPLNIVITLARSSIETADDAFQAAVTLLELYSKFITQNDLTYEQKELVRHDTARRMVTLARIAATRNLVVAFRIWFLMSRFCPREVPFSVAEAARRTTRYLLKSLP